MIDRDLVAWLLGFARQRETYEACQLVSWILAATSPRDRAWAIERARRDVFGVNT